MRFNARKLCALSVAAVAVGGLGALPGTAGAAFDSNHDQLCETVDSFDGVGASFQRLAQHSWGAEILAPDPLTRAAVGFGYASTANGGCASFAVGREVVEYSPGGSGAGRAAFGMAAANSRPTVLADVYNFGATDEPPNATEIDNARRGDTGVAWDDDTSVLIVPAVASAIPVVVRVPDGCSVSAADRELDGATIEGAFAGDAGYERWGDLFPGTISGTVTGTATACADQEFVRVVRQDSSGTTFAFKGFLDDVDPAERWPTYANTAWPAGVTTVVPGARRGAGALLDQLSAQSVSGGIGYADIATARSREYGYGASTNDANDVRFWVRVERASDGAFVSPAEYASTTGDNTSGRKGANCDRVVYSNVPTTTVDEPGWLNVTATPTSADYPICTLSYILAWKDPADFNRGFNNSDASFTSPFTQDQAAALRDYLGYILNTNSGGSSTTLLANDYAPLAANVRSVATGANGIAQLTWNN